jgi:hypothetical protein
VSRLDLWGRRFQFEKEHWSKKGEAKRLLGNFVSLVKFMRSVPSRRRSQLFCAAMPFYNNVPRSLWLTQAPSYFLTRLVATKYTSTHAFTFTFSTLQHCLPFFRTPLCTRLADPAPSTQLPALGSPPRHPPTTFANCITRHRHSPQAHPPPTDPCTSCPPLSTSPMTRWWNAPQGRWLRSRGRGIAPKHSPPKDPATRLRPWKRSARAAQKQATHTISGARTSGPSRTHHLACRDWTKPSPPGWELQTRRPT